MKLAAFVALNGCNGKRFPRGMRCRRGLLMPWAAVLAWIFVSSLQAQPTSTGCNGQPSSGELSLWLVASDLSTGQVQVNGIDRRQPNQPFVWSWGDGTATTGFFPQTHTYPSLLSDYVIRVTSNENDGSHDCAELAIPLGTTLAPKLIVSSYPGALVGVPGASIATSYTLTNNGGSSVAVALSQQGAFFSQSPQSFTLNPGQTQRVVITASVASAGVFEGSSIATGSGVGTLAIPVKVLLTAPPTTTVQAVPVSNRVDVSGVAGQSASVDVSFTNPGTSSLTGIVTSDALWAVPPNGPVTIPGGATVTVTVTIDRSRRSAAESNEGSARASIALVYLNGSTVAGKWANPAGGSAGVGTSTVSVVDTPRPNTSPGAIPALGTGELALFVPGVGHVQGSVGRFISDVALVNRAGQRPLSHLSLYHLPASGSASAATGLTLTSIAPAQSLVYGDAAKSIFNSESIGTIQIRGADLPDLAVSANVFNVSFPGGTYGSTIPVFRSDRAAAAGESLYLTGLSSQSGLTHTNLYFQETAGFPVSATVTFYDASGSPVGAGLAIDVGAFAVKSAGSSVPAGTTLAVVTNRAGSAGRLVAYATPVDELSGDTWSVADWPRLYGYPYDAATVIPIAGAAAGANATYFRTDVAISNVGTAAAAIAVDYVSASGGAASHQTISLAAHQTSFLSDIVTTVFKAAAPSLGYLSFTPAAGGRFAVTSRTYTTYQGQPATFGTAVPPVSREAAMRKGDSRKIGALDDAALSTIKNATPGTFRTNVGLVETSGHAVTVRLTLLYNDPAVTVSAKVYNSVDITLAPNEFRQINGMSRTILGPNRDTDYGDLRNVQLMVDVVSGDGTVLVYASSTDNGTGDSTVRLD